MPTETTSGEMNQGIQGRRARRPGRGRGMVARDERRAWTRLGTRIRRAPTKRPSRDRSGARVARWRGDVAGGDPTPGLGRQRRRTSLLLARVVTIGLLAKIFSRCASHLRGVAVIIFARSTCFTLPFPHPSPPFAHPSITSLASRPCTDLPPRNAFLRSSIRSFISIRSHGLSPATPSS